MTEEQEKLAQAERDRLVGLVSKTPVMLSLLYDLNLLPECVAVSENKARDEWYMLTTIAHLEVALKTATGGAQRHDGQEKT